jgi:hypothetical protein
MKTTQNSGGRRDGVRRERGREVRRRGIGVGFGQFLNFFTINTVLLGSVLMVDSVCQPVTEWTCTNVTEWMAALNIYQYAGAFQQHNIDGESLVMLNEDKLKVGIFNPCHLLS